MTAKEKLMQRVKRLHSMADRTRKHALDLQALHDSIPDRLDPMASRALTDLVCSRDLFATLLVVLCLLFCLSASAQVGANNPTTNAPDGDNALIEKVKKRDGTNYIGVFMGMIAEHDGKGSVSLSSATSGELLRWIPYSEFNDVYVLKIKPEYPATPRRDNEPPGHTNSTVVIPSPNYVASEPVSSLAVTSNVVPVNGITNYHSFQEGDIFTIDDNGVLNLQTNATLFRHGIALDVELRGWLSLTPTIRAQTILTSTHEPVVTKGTNGVWWISFPDVVKPEERGVTAGEAAVTASNLFKQGAAYGALTKMRNPDMEDVPTIIGIAERMFKAQSVVK
jgi:hypothetical protein